MNTELDLYDQRIVSRLFKKRRITCNECWEWTGACDTDGYGRISYRYVNERVHRISLKLFKPVEFKTGLLTLHSCNNKKCFNPDHLRSGSLSANAIDCVKAGTHPNASKTHCSRGHEYNPKNTYVNKRGGRICRVCKQEVKRRLRLYGY